jgi:energy-coupling factor transport system substrate-specific component
MVTVIAVLVLAYYYLLFEEKGMDTKTIAVLGMLSALSVAGRVVMAPIPNVQPATFIIITAGYVFGPLSGFMVGSTTALVSNFILGQGPWTIWQMLGWGLAGMIAGLLGKRNRMEGRLTFSLFCGAWGFIYGWMLTWYFVLGFVRPLTFQAYLTAYATGIWFDAFHAAGNFAFAFLFGPALVIMLRRYRSRFQFEHVDGQLLPGEGAVLQTMDGGTL